MVLLIPLLLMVEMVEMAHLVVVEVEGVLLIVEQEELEVVVEMDLF